VAVTEFLSCRPNLEVSDLAPAAAFLREVLGFEVEVDEPEMGLLLLRRDAVGLALVRSTAPGVNATTAAYIGVTGVDELHEQCAARGARIVTGLADHPWGLRDFVVEMPGGHRLALGERITRHGLCRQEPGANRPNRSPILLLSARCVRREPWLQALRSAVGSCQRRLSARTNPFPHPPEPLQTWAMTPGPRLSGAVASPMR
jgi:predicted enzyme related to lactoylglutathione lyase